MSAPVRRIVCAASAGVLSFAALVGLAWGRFGEARTVAVQSGEPPGEVSLVTRAQRQVGWFFEQGRVEAGIGRGLFETDFFKPPPPPPPKPKPAAPTSRELAVTYRGFGRFDGGAGVAYVVVDGRTLVLGAGDLVADGWMLGDFGPDGAKLRKGEQTMELPFNRRVALSVPVK